METTHLSEEMVTEILARLPLRSISRFKSVHKTWKSTLESAYFRRLFVSLHKNTSSSWSLMTSTKSKETNELFGFYGCQTWDLRKSLASLLPPFHLYKFKHHPSSTGLVLVWQVSATNSCFVGNPVLQQWVQIPPPPHDSSWSCLVTHVDDDGVVLSFKVVRLFKFQSPSDSVSKTMSVYLYSSETGIWTFKLIHCPYHITNLSFMTLNGTVYFYYLSTPRVFVAHDFYSKSNQFRVVHYPDRSSDDYLNFKRTLTTSRGFVMCVTTLAQEDETVFKVWRLNNDDSWQLLLNLGLPIIGNCVPLATHPFDSGIVYLWSRQNHLLVSCNLWTRNYRILSDGYNDEQHQDCFVDQSVCDKYVNAGWGLSYLHHGASIAVLQFVLPQWMESVLRPPQVEVLDTASLLSAVTLMEETRKRNEGDNEF